MSRSRLATGDASLPRLLVVAKAPVPGWAKTRLAADVGDRAAADLAAAALLDTLEAGGTFRAARRQVALAGDLAEACRESQVRACLRRWQVLSQRGSGLAERLALAHGDAAGRTGGSVIQIGMDTPQLRATDLVALAAGLDGADAVLGPATDGGWWGLALQDPAQATALLGVAMSTPATGRLTARALRSRGLRVRIAHELRDVDTAADADVVARQCRPGSHFAAAWAQASVAATSSVGARS